MGRSRSAGPHVLPAWAHPAIVIVFITGCFHLFRGAPIDGIVFLLVAFGLAVIETRWPADVLLDAPPRWPRGTRRLAYALVVAAALLVAVQPRYGDFDALLVCVGGFAALGDAAVRPSYEPPARPRAWPYAVIGVIAALDELTAYLMQTYAGADDHHFPALSDMLNPVIGWAPTRALLVGLWLAGGLALLRLMPRRQTTTEPEGDQRW